MAHADWSDVVRAGAGVLIAAIDLSVITMFVLDWWRGDTSEWQSPDDEED
jgi:hypothetical protein